MIKYVAFLRAVNVGKRQIKMVELKELFESLGFENVKTFIASGNVIFESDEESKKLLVEKIEIEIKKRFGFHSEVVLRTSGELNEIINKNPFSTIPLDKNTILYVGFLYGQMDSTSIQTIEKLNNDVDTFKVLDHEIYALRRKDKGESILNTNVLNKYIKIPMTMRNWNTVLKITSL
jgi:uncharacterized protein (DUF1697 family)